MAGTIKDDAEIQAAVEREFTGMSRPDILRVLHMKIEDLGESVSDSQLKAVLKAIVWMRCKIGA
jgi:hypothetical protein